MGLQLVQRTVRLKDTLSGAGAPPAGTGFGAGGAFGGGAARGKDLVQQTKDAFDLLLMKGSVTWAAGIKDIQAIAGAETAAGASATQVTKDVLHNSQTLIGKLLQQAKAHFDLDKEHHASQATLLKDE
jgi:hypothetical protein